MEPLQTLVIVYKEVQPHWLSNIDSLLTIIELQSSLERDPWCLDKHVKHKNDATKSVPSICSDHGDRHFPHFTRKGGTGPNEPFTGQDIVASLRCWYPQHPCIYAHVTDSVAWGNNDTTTPVETYRQKPSLKKKTRWCFWLWGHEGAPPTPVADRGQRLSYHNGTILSTINKVYTSLNRQSTYQKSDWQLWSTAVFIKLFFILRSYLYVFIFPCSPSFSFTSVLSKLLFSSVL